MVCDFEYFLVLVQQHKITPSIQLHRNVRGISKGSKSPNSKEIVHINPDNLKLYKIKQNNYTPAARWFSFSVPRGNRRTFID